MVEKSTKRNNIAFSYAFGNFGLNLFFQTIAVYLLYFYTDVLGITAAAAGMILLTIRLFDGATDIGIGLVVDRTKTRWGKFRPYILMGTVPMVILGVITFTTPDLGPSAMVVYAFTTYFLFGLFFTVVGVPYSSMLAVISKDYYERSKFASIKVVFGTAGMLVATTFTLPIAHQFDSEAQGFRMVAIIFGIFAILSLYLTFFKTKGIEDVNQELPSKEEYPIKKRLKVVTSNKPLLATLTFVLVNMLGTTVYNGSMVYFFTYVHNDVSVLPYYTGIGIGIQLIFVFLCQYFVGWLGKKPVAILSQIIFIAGLTGLFFIHNSLFFIFLFGMIAYIGIGIAQPLLWAMVSDTVEYGEWKTGYRGEGIIYSMFLFAQKMGAALGGSIAGGILSVTGYVANTAQTPTAILGILVALTIAPAIGGLIAIGSMFFHKLDAKTYNEIVAKINQSEQTKNKASKKSVINY